MTTEPNISPTTPPVLAKMESQRLIHPFREGAAGVGSTSALVQGSNDIPIFVQFLFETDSTQLIFSQHCGCWCLGAFNTSADYAPMRFHAYGLTRSIWPTRHMRHGTITYGVQYARAQRMTPTSVSLNIKLIITGKKVTRSSAIVTPDQINYVSWTAVVLVIKHQAWGLLRQFRPFRHFPHISSWSKHKLATGYYVYVWEMSPQLSCADTCEIWMWFEEYNWYFCLRRN